jgi:BirA family biotin operon repressor/biotin-[acetyl-CoA-carboxylase] ligase
MNPQPRWDRRTAGEWAVAWDVPKVVLLEAVGSTNDVARDRAGSGARPFTVILAEEQLRGRGRSGDPWFSPPGTGIWMSVLIPIRNAAAVPLLPLRVGLALSEAVESVSGALPGTARLKWPNDLMVLDRKIAGILCESARERSGVVAGVGINVLQGMEDFPDHLRGRAGSLKSVLGVEPGRGRLVGEFLRILRDGGALDSGSLSSDEKGAWELRDWLRERRIRVAGAVSDPVAGWGAGVTDDGALRVRGADGGVLEVRSGSVEVLPGSEGPVHEGPPSGQN